MDNIIHCNGCSQANPLGSKFCGKCGNTIIAVQDTLEIEMQKVSVCPSCKCEITFSFALTCPLSFR